MNDTTIIYCSSNMEDPKFEQRIRDTILKNCGGLDIVSVSQKPIPNFGKNIVVGDKIGVSGFNFFRQVQIACKEAKTKFVISAEADCCYPPDYFNFAPGNHMFWEHPLENMCYRNTNLYVMGDHRDYWFHKKEGATHSQIVGREFYLERLNKLFEGCPEWNSEEKNFPKERYRKEDVFGINEIVYYHTKNPVFQIKTHRSMRYYTHSERKPIYNLPYWGDSRKIRAYYMKGVTEKYVS